MVMGRTMGEDYNVMHLNGLANPLWGKRKIRPDFTVGY